MASRNLIFSDEALIRKRSREVKNFDENLWTLLDDMKETMKKNDGCGLAAPQVGILRRICVVESEGMYLELINPVITKQSGTQCSEEGCLSVKDYTGLVDRPQKITVKAFNRMGVPFTITVEDFSAIVCSHEIDHLDGILFIDKAKKLFSKVV